MFNLKRVNAIHHRGKTMHISIGNFRQEEKGEREKGGKFLKKQNKTKTHNFQQKKEFKTRGTPVSD